MDIRTLLAQMQTSGALGRLARNPLAQFGARGRRYIGAEILPERTVELNQYTEENVRFRSVIANAGPRYGPVQIKGGALIGSVDVKLFESDIGSEFTSRDLDALISWLGRNQTMEAIASVTRWLDTTVNVPLVEWNERARWQAIVDSQVLLVGDNDYRETVPYTNPAGHRANAAGVWGNDAYDPFDDIFNRVELLASKGFETRRIITSRKVIGILAGNAKVAARTNRITVSAGGQISGINGRVSLDVINTMMQGEGLPNFELYDLQYRTSTGTGRFLRDNVMVFVGATGATEELDLGDDVEILEDTLGYVGIGRAAGQGAPGRVVRSEFFENKPPRIEGEGWQTSAPVILEPEAIATIDAIAAA